MQIYVTAIAFADTAFDLSDSDLKSQIKNIVTVLETLHETDKKYLPFEEHPVTLQWRGHEVQLCNFGHECLDALFQRRTQVAFDSRDELEEFSALADRIEWHLQCASSGDCVMEKPLWVKLGATIMEHRSALMRHDIVYYRKKWPSTPLDVAEYWPTD